MPDICFRQPEIVNALTFVYKDRIVCKLFSQIEVLKNVNVDATVVTNFGKSEEFNVSTDENGFVTF